MNSINLKVKIFFVIVSIVLISGCTTSVGKVKKLPGYDKKISDVVVSWHMPANLRTQIKISGPGKPTVGPEERGESKRGVETLLSLFSEYSVDMVTDKLIKNSVVISADTDAALQQLKLTATQGHTDCVPVGCTHNLWIRAYIIDTELKKTVWSGYFKVGKPYAEKSVKDTIDNFAESLVDELKSSDLI